MDRSATHAPWSLRGGFPRAVVFVHGIMGSPAQFRALGKVLYAAGWDCIALCLPGHGGSAEEFASARGAHWTQSFTQALAEEAPRYTQLVLFAHSLGGLLSIQAAAREQHRIAGIVLLCPALLLKVSPWQAWRSARVLYGNPARDDALLAAYRAAYSVGRGKPLAYLRWVAPLLDLARLARSTWPLVPAVHCPVLALQSAHDESVRKVGVKKLQRLLPAARIVWLAHSTHVYFTPEDAVKIGEETLAFLDGIQCRGIFPSTYNQD